MDPNALDVLEFPAIRERVAGAAATEHGAALAAELEPSPEPGEVARRQALTAEAIALLDESLEPPLDKISDIRDQAAHAALGGALAPQALRRVSDTATGSLRARAALDEAAAPLLRELAAAIDPALAHVAKAIDRAVEEDGSDLRDNASPKLRKLRGELRTGRQRVRDKLEQLVRSSELREHLQEEFITLRGGRPVLAVKASARRSVPGIVHDASDSGQTLFVEPFDVVELSNRQSEATSAEREEVERILRELSATVAEAAPLLTAAVEATGQIDLTMALGTLSRGWKGAPVEVVDEVRLAAARHPLLDPRSAVPIDLDLGSLRALVISGPNTGGKTVALKTLGLAALLHQAGLRPPAETAALPVFDQVLADIGDRQSIEMSLSTFSGHVASIVAILNAAGERSLVLLDELASGTDPVEGSALAQALVARLAEQARLTLVTTHYPELKEWASASEGVANAGDGLRSGHACAALPNRARPSGNVARASDRRAAGAGHGRRRGGARARHPRAAADPGAARRNGSGRARRRRRAYVRDGRAGRSGAAERQRARARARARSRDRGGEGISGGRARARRRRRAARPRGGAGGARGAARGDPPGPAASAERAGARPASRRRHAARCARRACDPGARPAAAVHGSLAEGDPVEAPDLGVHGTILAIEGDDAEVVGASGQRIRIPLARLRPSRQREPEAEQPVKVVAMASGDVSDELDVRGLRAQEAREAVRSFVDDAALAGLPSVRVIHGRGTGSVRAAVRDELDGHPLVDRRESDSADGATVAHLQ